MLRLALVSVSAVVPLAAAEASSTFGLWTAELALPSDAVARPTSRGGDFGWGVDMRFKSGTVKAIVRDDDGDGFFEVRRGNASCKIDVGSDGQAPGLRVSVFAQSGLRCAVSGDGGPRAFKLKVAADFDENGEAECEERADYEAPCSPAWLPPAASPSVPPSWALWTARIALPAGSTVQATQRVDDPGYGVDLKARRDGDKVWVDAYIWDDDGDNFFQVSLGNGSSCKVDVGSNGLGPGLQVMIFEQVGMGCAISGKGGPKNYNVTIDAEVSTDGSADCEERADTEEPCSPAWVAAEEPSAAAVLPSGALWRARIAVPAGSTVRHTTRGGDPGYGVDLQVHQDSGKPWVDAIIWDDDGSNFFAISMGHSSVFCKVVVGSNGLGPGLQVMIFEQVGMQCAISGNGGPQDYSVTIDAHASADGSADCKERADTEEPCSPAWRPDDSSVVLAAVPPSGALWRAHITLPEGSSVRPSARGGDRGYGVDLRVRGSIVDASVWDSDGDAFLEVVLGSSSCKLDVGSDGQAPGIKVEVFAQHGGIQCLLSGSGGPQQYHVLVTAQRQSDGSASDCSDATELEAPCGATWRPSSSLSAATLDASTAIVLV